MLVAIATASSISLAAFAADDISGTANRDIMADSDTAVRPSTRVSQGSDGSATVGTNELFLVDTDRNVIGGIYNRLDPDTEYTFRIHYNDTGAPITNATSTSAAALTESMLQKGTLRLRTVKGSSAIQSARIKTVGRGDGAMYDLVIKTRAAFGTKINEVEYSLGVTGNTGGTFADSSHIFEVGHETISDNETDIGEGGYITISNDFPVITKEQFTDIAKSVNYKTVNFEGEDGGWTFVGRVSGMGDSNFYYSYDVVPDLINKFPDQEYKFLTFNAGVTFPSTGEMRIDVSDISDSFKTIYTYLYRNGKLTRVDATHDAVQNEIVFRTNYLGNFVITDKAITDTSIVDENEEETGNENENENETGNENGSGNPNTGASSAMNVAVALGLVSLVTAGAISRKRK